MPITEHENNQNMTLPYQADLKLMIKIWPETITIIWF